MVAVNKSEYRKKIEIEGEMRVSISNITDNMMKCFRSSKLKSRIKCFYVSVIPSFFVH